MIPFLQESRGFASLMVISVVTALMVTVLPQLMSVALRPEKFTGERTKLYLNLTRMVLMEMLLVTLVLFRYKSFQCRFNDE